MKGRDCLIIGLVLSQAGSVCADAELVSVNSDNLQANGTARCREESYQERGQEVSISRDGRFVAFNAKATNLSPDDIDDEAHDVYLRDRQRGATRLISQTPGIVEIDVCHPSLSSNGRYVAFETFASLLADDTRFPSGDIYVYDQSTELLELASVDSSGAQLDGHNYAATISRDGQIVAFQTYAGVDTPQIIVRDRTSETTGWASRNSSGVLANGQCDNPAISADGRFVAFDSWADNLDLRTPDTNSFSDVFVHDRISGETIRVSVDSSGHEANSCAQCDFSWSPSLSENGRYVAFVSSSPQLVPDDTNNRDDIFLHDRVSGETTRISLDAAGRESNGDSWDPVISGDGRYVAFVSVATNLIPLDIDGYADVFVRDRVGGLTYRISTAYTADPEPNGPSATPSISLDGSFVAFQSLASNLGNGDTTPNGWDVFVAPNGAVDPSEPTGQTFIDVPADYWAFDFVEHIADFGLALPCAFTPLAFCPTRSVTRAEVAFFLERAVRGGNYNAPPATGKRFLDVPNDRELSDWIELLADDRIYMGCQKDKFCPERYFNRGMLSQWVLRAKHGIDYMPPPASGKVFTDVASTDYYAPWIEQVAAEKIIMACHGDRTRFCPYGRVRRDFLAMVLARAFQLHTTFN